MSRTIDISDETYSRLEKHAKGFDTPEAVIERLLDQVEGTPETKPDLIFTPSDESKFKLELIKSKVAEVVLYKTDGSREINRWNANKISESSNLRGNLWSGPLRGWKGKGIKRAELFVLPQTVLYPDGDDDGVALDKAVAQALNLTFDEVRRLDYGTDENSSDDGLVYGHYITVNVQHSDPEVLKFLGIGEDGDNTFYVNLD